MAKRKKAKANPWDAVFKRIRVQYLGSRNYPPKTTDDELDEVESQFGFLFPQSYRTFAKQFGLGGLLGGGIELLGLRGPEHGEGDPMYFHESVTRLTRAGRREPESFFWEPWEGPQVDSSRFVVFAQRGDDGPPETWMFHPWEITNSATQECRIYTASVDYRLTLNADSFAEWLTSLDPACEEPEVEPRNQPRVFKPNPSGKNTILYQAKSVSCKSTPAALDVKSWLAFNNNTVRNLALSIRDEKRSDAFPILADALEEAGCTNADMLESCRRGDPDIDGLWVLRVLLGTT